VKPEKQAPFDYLSMSDPDRAADFVYTQEGQDSGGLGKSSVGAALAFTRSPEGQELVRQTKETIDMMRKSDKNYDPVTLKAIEDLTGSDIRDAQRRLAMELFKPQTARIKEAEKRPEVVETARQRSAATTMGKEGAEQSILGNTTIPGLEPIEGVRQTEESIKNVKKVQPDVETMKTLADELIRKYETMGSVFTGDDAADYSSKVRNLQLLAKSPALYNLGVLTGPDLQLLEESIPNPSSIKEGVKKTVLGDLGIRLQNFRDLIDKRATQFYRTNGFQYEQQDRGTPGVTTPKDSGAMTDEFESLWSSVQ
jgi:hypothetical protein